MNYFKELLESFDSLKKRKFKLHKLNEAEESSFSQDDYNQAAINALGFFQTNLPSLENIKSQQALTGPTITNDQGNSLQAYAKKDQNNQVVGIGFAFGGRNLGIFINSVNGSLSWKPGVESNSFYKKLLEKFLAPEDKQEKDRTPEEKGEVANINSEVVQQQEQEMLAQQKQMLGGTFELLGIRDKETLKVLEDITKTLSDFCLIVGNHKAYRNICSDPNMFIAGGIEGQGLEAKLAFANSVVLDSPEKNTYKIAPLDNALRRNAARTYSYLVNLLTSDRLSGKDKLKSVKERNRKCYEIQSKISYYKSKENIILFGSNRTEGVVVKIDPILDQALKKAQNICGGEGFDYAQSDEVNEKEKNRVKGSFYELLLESQINYLNGDRKAFKQLADFIDSTKIYLAEIAAEADLKVSFTLDEFYNLKEQKELYKSIKDNKSLLKFLQQELYKNQKFIKFCSPDKVVNLSKSNVTGERSDLIFLYRDQLRANKLAFELGAEVFEHEGLFGFGVGLKRVNALRSIKLGEINSNSRMLSLVLGSIQDRFIEPGFEKSMRDKQFAGLLNAEERIENMKQYALDLEQKIEKSTKPIIEDQIYINSKGDIKNKKSFEVIENLAKITKQKFDYNKIKESLLVKAFYDFDKNNEPVLKNFHEDDEIALENKAIAKEIVGRVYKVAQLKKDIEMLDSTDDIESKMKRKQAAIDYVLKMLLVAGSNSKDIAQLISDDKGSVKSFNHNQLFNQLCSENRSGANRLSFHFSESEITVNCSLGSITLKLEQNKKDSGERDTRFSCKVQNSTLSNLYKDFSPESKIKEDNSLNTFIEKQLKLIESLLIQTKNNQAD